MMKVGWSLVLVLSLVCVGCDGGKGGGSGTPGVAHVVQGATAPAAFQLTGTGVASDGNWKVTPDRVQVTITRLNLHGVDAANDTGADLVDCTVTYDRANASGESLLDCPFTVDAGSYTNMDVFTDGTVQILISDAVNGIYTDPASSTGLSSIAPAGGAALVPVTTTLGGGSSQYFVTPLVVGSGASLSLSLVVDAVQTTDVIVSGSGTVLEFGDYSPVRIFPTIGDPGVPQFYNSLGTAESYNSSLVLPHLVRVYFGAGVGAQPIVASFDQLATTLNSCQAGASGLVYSADPASSPPWNANGDRAGGWLGLDSSNNICGALAEGGVPNYSQYHSYFSMQKAANVGDSTTFACELTTAPTPPTSGTTYASGCPAFVAVLGSAQLMLVAD